MSTSSHSKSPFLNPPPPDPHVLCVRARVMNECEWVISAPHASYGSWLALWKKYLVFDSFFLDVNTGIISLGPLSAVSLSNVVSCSFFWLDTCPLTQLPSGHITCSPLFSSPLLHSLSSVLLRVDGAASEISFVVE